MRYPTFEEYVIRRDEGQWLPNKPIVAGMNTINAFPVSQTRLDRIVPKQKATGLVKPAVPKVIPSPLGQLTKAISDFPSFRG